jgi:hypothetical protein
MKKKLLVVMERDKDNDWQAWSEDPDTGTLLPVIAPTVEGVLAQIRELITDLKENEWKNELSWATVDVEKDLEFEFAYSVVGLFDEFKFIKIGEIAKAAGLNPALVRAYASGDKNPSLAQAKKIEQATHRLAQSLLLVRLVPQTA